MQDPLLAKFCQCWQLRMYVFTLYIFSSFWINLPNYQMYNSPLDFFLFFFLPLLPVCHIINFPNNQNKIENVALHEFLEISQDSAKQRNTHKIPKWSKQQDIILITCKMCITCRNKMIIDYSKNWKHKCHKSSLHLVQEIKPWNVLLKIIDYYLLHSKIEIQMTDFTDEKLHSLEISLHSPTEATIQTPYVHRFTSSGENTSNRLD